MSEDNSALASVNNDSQQQADLNYYASLAFDGVVPADVQQAASGEQGSNVEDNQNAAAAAIDNTETLPVEDFLKNELGFDNIDAVKSALQEYNNFKKNPPSAEPKFANDEAKRWYEYFSEGKEDELYSSLSARQQVKNIDSMPDEDKVRLYIKMQNPLFEPKHVDYLYKKEYGFDENQFKDEDGTVIDQDGLDFAKISAQQKMKNDVLKANEYFSQYKSKIELSPIQRQTQIDESYEAYKASTAKDLEHYQKDVEPAIKNLKSTDVGLQLKVADNENQMDFNVSIDVTPEDLELAKTDALNLSNYLDKECYQDGKFVPQKYAQMMLKARNFDKYGQTIARQAVMAERKRVQLKNSVGGNGFSGGMRDYDLGKQDELKALEQMAFPN